MMRKSFALSALLCTLVLSPLCADEIDGCNKNNSDLNHKLQDCLRLAQAGDGNAAALLGSMYAEGEGVDQDMEQAAKWMLQAAEGGHWIAMHNLALYYAHGSGVPESKIEAYRWEMLSAHPEAESVLEGLRREMTPEEVAQAAALARAWRPRTQVPAPQSGDEENCLAGDFAPEAMASCERLANAGDRQAQVKFGFGLAQSGDHQAAVKWYRKAADQGLPIALLLLGQAYDFGEGVEEDAIEAIYWYSLAAEQGFAEAQFALGATYASGEGVPQNYEQAVAWYLKAAEQGHYKAQNNLATLYSNDEVSVEDLVEAYKWYTISAASALANGEDDSVALANRDRLATRMTSDQIAEAGQRVRGWQAEHHE